MSSDWKNLLPQKCDWCPLACGANRFDGYKGLCGADNKLIVAKSQLHYWEEPVISGTIGGPKRGLGPGSGTIFFANCNLKCVYCQNYQISDIQNIDNPYDTNLDELINIMLDFQNKNALNINLVTACHYRSHIITAVRQAKKQGLTIPVIWNTSGYESVASIYALNDTVDVWLTDFKYSDNKLAQSYSKNNIRDYVDICLDALDAMVSIRGKCKFDMFDENIRMTSGVIVRHLLLPGKLDNSKKSLKILFDNFGNSIKYSIMNQYTPIIAKNSKIASEFPELLETVSNEDYEELLDYADELGIEDYYWQDGLTCSESFIPNWDIC